MSDPTPPILSYAPDADRLTRIGPFRDLLEAEMAATRLQNEGINASVGGANLATTLGPVYGAAYGGGPYLLVPEADEAAARALIAQIETARKNRLNADLPACPVCGKNNVAWQLHPLKWLALLCGLIASVIAGGLWLLAIVVIAALLWPTLPRWKCRDCGHHFAAQRPVAAIEDDENELDENHKEGEA